MIIKRTSNWYRPYSIELSTGVYKVDDIIFYDNYNIVCHTGCGWLSKGSNGYSENDITSIELPVDSIKLRRKEKFDGSVFAMTCRKDYERDTVAILYIPADMLNIKFDKYYISLNILFAQYTGDNGIVITQSVKSLTGKLNEIRDEYKTESKHVERYHLHGTVNDMTEVIDHLSRMIELAKECKAEQERLNGLSIEDALAE